jgi:hypothetical protein
MTCLALQNETKKEANGKVIHDLKRLAAIACVAMASVHAHYPYFLWPKSLLFLAIKGLIHGLN